MKLVEKLSKVNDNFVVNMYDNGFMIDVSGRDSNGEWENCKVICSTIEELMKLVNEAITLPRDN